MCSLHSCQRQVQRLARQAASSCGLHQVIAFDTAHLSRAFDFSSLVLASSCFKSATPLGCSSLCLYISIQTKTAFSRKVSEDVLASIARRTSGRAFLPLSASASSAGDSSPHRNVLSAPVFGIRKSRSLTRGTIAGS